MANIYEKLTELNLELPKVPSKGGIYSPARKFGKNLVYISGCGPVVDKQVSGVFGREFTKEDGLELSRNSMLNVLAVLEAEIGDLNKVKQPVKILTFVASESTFSDQPFVADGGSQLLVDLFGEENAPSRSAIGVNVLPGNIPVETEALFELLEE